MTTIKDFGNIIKVAKFFDNYTSISSGSGILHRVNGKSTAKGKEKELTAEDKVQIKSGIDKLTKDLADLKKKI